MFNTIEIDAKDGKKYKVSSVNIVKNDMEKEKRTYQAYINSKVVYDSNSYNFHVFPSDEKICDVLSNEISLLRKEIINNIEDIKNKINIVKTNSDFKKLIIVKDHKYLLKWYGSRPKKRYRYLYKFATIYCNNAYYSINFMRYICKDNVIGCTMRAIQFHKSCGNINKANGFNICYTVNDENNTHKSIKYTIMKNKKKIVYENVCYNPPVEWPNKQPFDLNATTFTFEKSSIEEIIGRFLDFIENNEKDGFYKNSKRNKKGYGQDYLKNKFKNAKIS